MTSKYHNVKVGKYDSKKEAHRAQELDLLVKAGVIRSLVHHPIFRLDVGPVLIGNYEADFSYFEGTRFVVEDVKGVRTPVYKLKKKLMKAIHNIDILET